MSALTPKDVTNICSYLDPNGDGVDLDEFIAGISSGLAIAEKLKAEKIGRVVLADLVTAVGNVSALFSKLADDNDGDESSVDGKALSEALSSLGFRKISITYLLRYLTQTVMVKSTKKKLIECLVPCRLVMRRSPPKI